ncbi:hypothetical protein AB3S75_020133 [Citrus x aurantiifolia]
MHDVETVRDLVVKCRKGHPPCQRKNLTKFSKYKSARSNVKDGHVSDQVATMIPTFQNLQQSFVDRNMYPHGVIDYSNGLMNLQHITGDNVYPTATQNSSTHQQLQPQVHGHFQQLLFQQNNEYGVNREFGSDFKE